MAKLHQSLATLILPTPCWLSFWSGYKGGTYGRLNQRHATSCMFGLHKILEYGAQMMPDYGLHSILAQLPFCFAAGLKDVPRKVLSGASNCKI